MALLTVSTRESFSYFTVVMAYELVLLGGAIEDARSM
jgi:hypothetical protein